MRVVELFAGVGGFRIGFEGPPDDNTSKEYSVVWANQWEPSTKKQHAAEVYAKRWNMKRSESDPDVYVSNSGDVLVNKDIGEIPAEDVPDRNSVRGFPLPGLQRCKAIE